MRKPRTRSGHILIACALAASLLTLARATTASAVVGIGPAPEPTTIVVCAQSASELPAVRSTVEAQGARVAAESEYLPLILVVAPPEGESPATYAAVASSIPGVRYAEVNGIVQIAQVGSEDATSPISVGVTGEPPYLFPSVPVTITLVATDTATDTISIHYSLDGAAVQTSQRAVATVVVATQGEHELDFWADDAFANVGPHAAFDFWAGSQQTVTTLTVGASPTTVKLPKPFVLSGLLKGAPADGLVVSVMVKRPGKRYFSYSSARLTYAAAGPASRWWYRYVPRDRGTYQFYVSFSGDVALVGSTSNLVTVHVR